MSHRFQLRRPVAVLLAALLVLGASTFTGASWWPMSSKLALANNEGDASLSGKASCGQDGGWSIVWTLGNKDKNHALTIENGGTVFAKQTVGANGSVSATEDYLDAATPSRQLTVTVKWNGQNTATVSVTVLKPSNCGSNEGGGPGDGESEVLNGYPGYICHGPLGHAGTKFNKIPVNQNSFWKPNGHSDHQYDIIPPFSYTAGDGPARFPGLNWTDENKAVYDNDCSPIGVTGPDCRVLDSKVVGGQADFTVGPADCVKLTPPISFSTYNLPTGKMLPWASQQPNEHAEDNGAQYGPGAHTLTASIDGLCNWQSDLYWARPSTADWKASWGSLSEPQYGPSYYDQKTAPHLHPVGGLKKGWDLRENQTCAEPSNPGLSIKKIAKAPGGINQDDTFQYDLVYSNPGDVTLENAVVTDVIPVGVTFISAVVPDGVGSPIASGRTHTFTIPTLAPGASGTITITVQADSFGVPATANSCLPDRNVTNTATVAAMFNGDEVTAEDSVQVKVSAPNLTLSKTSNKDGQRLEPGDRITYTITVMNNGGTAKNIIVTDVVPAGTKFESQSSSVADSDATASHVRSGNVNTWTFGELLWSKTATITFTVKVTDKAAAQISNSATLTSTGCTLASGTVVNEVRTCVPNEEAKFKHGWIPLLAVAWVQVQGNLPLCAAEPVTLATYRMPTATSAEWSVPQYLFDSDTKSIPKIKNGMVFLAAQVPACYAQVDLFFGGKKDIINPLTGYPLYGDRKLGPSSTGAPGNRSSGPNTSNRWVGNKECGSTVTIEKFLDSSPQPGVTFEVGTNEGGPKVPSGPITTGNDGKASFAVKFDQKTNGSLRITEQMQSGQKLVSFVCTADPKKHERKKEVGGLDGETWYGSISENTDLHCTVHNETKKATITITKLVGETPQSGVTFSASSEDGVVITSDPDDGTTGDDGEVTFEVAGIDASATVDLAETPVDGYELESASCQLKPAPDEGDEERTLSAQEESLEWPSITVRDGDEVECTVHNTRIKKDEGGSKGPGTEGGSTPQLPEAPLEVGGVKTGPTPQVTDVKGGKTGLPYTGAPVTAALTFSVALLAGGALLLLVGSRPSRRRG